jgi:hypothetical protein
MSRSPLAIVAILMLTAFVRAQDVPSGPETGKSLPALKVFAATGPFQDKDVDYAAERKDRPTVYLLIQADKFTRPMARFMRTLDEEGRKLGEDPYIVAVWLASDVEKTKEYLPRAQQSLRFERTALTCFTGDRAGPKDWNINADAGLTAVIARKGKVTTLFGYRSINETDAPKVLAALKNSLGKE